MPDNFYGGLDFGTSGARISIINLQKKLVYSIQSIIHGALKIQILGSILVKIF